MIILYYHVFEQLGQPSLVKLADAAARAWMKALNEDLKPVDLGRALVGGPVNRVYISRMPAELADVTIRFGAVNRSQQPDRVAQHGVFGPHHTIMLASDVVWSVTPWQRFWGIGQEDAYAALLHEFGHAMGLPHSNINSDVMAPDLGTTVISADEARRYRRFLDQPSHPIHA